MMRALFTSSAAAFVPFNVVEMQMMDQPFYYGINQVSKEPIWANRKKLMNGNGFVSLYLVVEKVLPERKWRRVVFF